ncbi:hypothetical protein BAUCODRAFT_194721 [Baudoinia panamericana UAMH 10762]|uniref:Complex 1 LYR protein domain-containing protein n=1 Tax=Baudoinia panamericana (strain UAMH 10762) TaxID=717646 RepID=M2NNJ5_BAUPA|nr:uncharacterized protein BAUCODRAFT_194721 [Baudoinia panamericana UAMH 10762]EMD01075.1 hypothetical protein BAUCODRAFT_194721 [Baudoinia panamericana UAMH 10762]
MPNYRIPVNQSRHRVAALALFRALLTQCRALPSTTSSERSQLQNVVRNRFKEARREQSGRRLRLLFEAGYEAVDHLDAAVLAGSEGSKAYILDLLARAPEKAKQTPSVTVSDEVLRQFNKQLSARPGQDTTGKQSMLNRPLRLDKLSGKRHVPVLFNAQGIPVLRFKKPQPESLSGYINHRLQVRHKRHALRHMLDDALEMARAEDGWDDLMRVYVTKAGETSRGEPSWVRELYQARKEVNERLDAERRKNQMMAEKMQAIVDGERQMAEKERSR